MPSSRKPADSVGFEQRGEKAEFSVFDDRPRAERHVASASEPVQELPLRADAERRGFVVDGREQIAGLLVVRTALDGDSTLPGRGKHFLDDRDLQPVGDDFLSEARQRGACDDQGVEFVVLENFAQARRDVAADFHNL